VTAAAGTLSGTTLAAGVTASSLTSLGTIASLTATAGTVATTPTASTDIANKLYVDTVAQGLDAKASCVAATTADITLSGAQTIDGVSIIAGNRVLVKNQSLSQNNGLYLCASGSWTRTTDANTWDALTSAFTFIEQGTTNADCGFVCTANAGGTLGTTALPWSQFSGAGTFTAGTGLTLTGSVFSLTSPVAVANGGTGLTSLGSGVATFLGTPSSANLAAAVTDETGSGALVFASSPTLVTPTLGAATATSLNGVTLTGTSTPALSVTGTASVSGTNTGDQTTITGNAGTATILQTARNINGVSFNGSADITVTAAAGTLTGATLAAGVTASSLTSLGTITSLTATALTVNDNTTLGSSNSDTVNFNARVASDLNPSTDDTYDLGIVGHEWRNLRIDGTANIDSLVADTADINGGTIDGTAIGGSTAAAGAFTTLSSTLGANFATSSGAVNIGPSVPAFGAKLNISNGNSAQSSVLFLNPGVGSGQIGIAAAGSNFKLYNTFADGLLANGVGIDITSTGNVGIGTASPGVSLQVNGIIRAATSADAGVLSLGESTGGTAVNVGLWRGLSNSLSGGNVLNLGGYSGIQFSTGAAVIGSQTSRMFLSDTGLAVTGALSSTTGATFATSSGDVGIGTASPASKLHVATSAGSGATIASFGSTTNVRIKLINEDATYGATIQSDAGSPFFLVAGSAGSGANLALGANGTEVVRIAGTNVGIGTTSPGSKLDVNGELRIGNTVATAVAVSSTHKVTIVIGGTTYYLLATNV
jgi:hypothetical protein